jgi:hypothetical protein
MQAMMKNVFEEVNRLVHSDGQTVVGGSAIASLVTSAASGLINTGKGKENKSTVEVDTNINVKERKRIPLKDAHLDVLEGVEKLISGKNERPDISDLSPELVELATGAALMTAAPEISLISLVGQLASNLISHATDMEGKKLITSTQQAYVTDLKNLLEYVVKSETVQKQMEVGSPETPLSDTADSSSESVGEVKSDKSASGGRHCISFGVDWRPREARRLLNRGNKKVKNILATAANYAKEGYATVKRDIENIINGSASTAKTAILLVVVTIISFVVAYCVCQLAKRIMKIDLPAIIECFAAFVAGVGNFFDEGVSNIIQSIKAVINKNQGSIETVEKQMENTSATALGLLSSLILAPLSKKFDFARFIGQLPRITQGVMQVGDVLRYFATHLPTALKDGIQEHLKIDLEVTEDVAEPVRQLIMDYFTLLGELPRYNQAKMTLHEQRNFERSVGALIDRSSTMGGGLRGISRESVQTYQMWTRYHGLILSNFAKVQRRVEKERVRPVTVYIESQQAGVGKDSFVDLILPFLTTMIGDCNPFIYHWNEDSPHLDGFMGQPVIWIQDLGQSKSQTSENVASAMTRLSGRHPYHVLMADLSEKGMTARPKLIFITSNIAARSFKRGLQTQQGFIRRCEDDRGITVRMTAKTEFATVNSNVVSWQWPKIKEQQLKLLSENKDNLNPDYYFSHVNFQIRHNEKKGDDWTQSSASGVIDTILRALKLSELEMQEFTRNKEVVTHLAAEYFKKQRHPVLLGKARLSLDQNWLEHARKNAQENGLDPGVINGAYDEAANSFTEYLRQAEVVNVDQQVNRLFLRQGKYLCLTCRDQTKVDEHNLHETKFQRLCCEERFKHHAQQFGWVPRGEFKSQRNRRLWRKKETKVDHQMFTSLVRRAKHAVFTKLIFDKSIYANKRFHMPKWLLFRPVILTQVLQWSIYYVMGIPVAFIENEDKSLELVVQKQRNEHTFTYEKLQPYFALTQEEIPDVKAFITSCYLYLSLASMPCPHPDLVLHWAAANNQTRALLHVLGSKIGKIYPLPKYAEWARDHIDEFVSAEMKNNHNNGRAPTQEFELAYQYILTSGRIELEEMLERSMWDDLIEKFMNVTNRVVPTLETLKLRVEVTLQEAKVALCSFNFREALQTFYTNLVNFKVTKSWGISVVLITGAVTAMSLAAVVVFRDDTEKQYHSTKTVCKPRSISTRPFTIARNSVEVSRPRIVASNPVHTVKLDGNVYLDQDIKNLSTERFLRLAKEELPRMERNRSIKFSFRKQGIMSEETSSGWMWGVQGYWYYACSHYFKKCDPTTSVYLQQGEKKLVCEFKDLVVIPFVTNDDKKAETEKSLVFFDPTKTSFSSLFPMTSTARTLLRRDDLNRWNSFDQCVRVESKDGRLEVYPVGPLELLDHTFEADGCYEPNVLVSETPGILGTCGARYYVLAKGTWTPIGIHWGTSTNTFSSHSLAYPIFKEDIEEAKEMVTNVHKVVLEMTGPDLEGMLTDKWVSDPTWRADTFETYGTLQPAWRNAEPMKGSLIRGPWGEHPYVQEVFKTKDMPLVNSADERIKTSFPMELTLNNLKRKASSVPITKNYVPADLYGSTKQVVQNFTFRQKDSPLILPWSVDQALNGDDETPSIAMDKSVGTSLAALFKFQKKKDAVLIDIPEDAVNAKNHYVLKAEVSEILLDWIERLNRNETPPWVMKSGVKPDELTKKKKILENRSRGLTTPDFLHLLLSRVYFGSLMANVKQGRVYNGSAIGLVNSSTEIVELVAHLTDTRYSVDQKFMEEFGAGLEYPDLDGLRKQLRIIAGDWSSQESYCSVPFLFVLWTELEKVYQSNYKLARKQELVVECEFYGTRTFSEEEYHRDAAVRWQLLYSATVQPLACGSRLLTFTCGLMTGTYLTALLQTFHGIIHINMAVYGLLKGTPFQKWSLLKDASKICDLNDDYLLSLHPHLREHVTLEKITQYLAKLGMVHTHAAKSGYTGDQPLIVEDCVGEEESAPFLSFNISTEGPMVYNAHMCKETKGKMLATMTSSSTIPSHELTFAIAMSYTHAVFWEGRDSFEYEMDLLKKYYKPIGKAIDFRKLPTYNDLEEHYLVDTVHVKDAKPAFTFTNRGVLVAAEPTMIRTKRSLKSIVGGKVQFQGMVVSKPDSVARLPPGVPVAYEQRSTMEHRPHVTPMGDMTGNFGMTTRVAEESHTIAELASTKKALFATVKVADTDQQGKLLAQFPLAPFLEAGRAKIGEFVSESMAGYLTMQGAFWTGNLVVTVQMVANVMASCKIQAVTRCGAFTPFDSIVSLQEASKQFMNIQTLNADQKTVSFGFPSYTRFDKGLEVPDWTVFEGQPPEVRVKSTIPEYEAEKFCYGMGAIVLIHPHIASAVPPEIELNIFMSWENLTLHGYGIKNHTVSSALLHARNEIPMSRFTREMKVNVSESKVELQNYEKKYPDPIEAVKTIFRARATIMLQYAARARKIGTFDEVQADIYNLCDIPGGHVLARINNEADYDILKDLPYVRRLRAFRTLTDEVLMDLSLDDDDHEMLYQFFDDMVDSKEEKQREKLMGRLTYLYLYGEYPKELSRHDIDEAYDSQTATENWMNLGSTIMQSRVTYQMNTVPMTAVEGKGDVESERPDIKEDKKSKSLGMEQTYSTLSSRFVPVYSVSWDVSAAAGSKLMTLDIPTDILGEENSMGVERFLFTRPEHVELRVTIQQNPRASGQLLLYTVYGLTAVQANQTFNTWTKKLACRPLFIQPGRAAEHIYTIPYKHYISSLKNGENFAVVYLEVMNELTFPDDPTSLEIIVYGRLVEPSYRLARPTNPVARRVEGKVQLQMMNESQPVNVATESQFPPVTWVGPQPDSKRDPGFAGMRPQDLLKSRPVFVRRVNDNTSNVEIKNAELLSSLSGGETNAQLGNGLHNLGNIYLMTGGSIDYTIIGSAGAITTASPPTRKPIVSGLSDLLKSNIGFVGPHHASTTALPIQTVNVPSSSVYNFTLIPKSLTDKGSQYQSGSLLLHVPEQSARADFFPVNEKYTSYIFAQGGSDFTLGVPQFIPDLYFADTPIQFGADWDTDSTPSNITLPASLLIEHKASAETYPGRNSVVKAPTTWTGVAAPNSTDSRGFLRISSFTLSTSGFSKEDWERFGFYFKAHDNLTFEGTQKQYYDLSGVFGLHKQYTLDVGLSNPQLELRSLPVTLTPSDTYGILESGSISYNVCSVMTLHYYEITREVLEEWFKASSGETFLAVDDTTQNIRAVFTRKVSGVFTPLSGEAYHTVIHMPSTLGHFGIEYQSN